jgi:two-component system chemotaxis response regulator CheY
LARIMIVDDDEFLHIVFERLLLKLGHEVCARAYNGREAINKYVECHQKPDLILMDQRMPIMSGIEATSELLKIDPNVKIIFVSADETISAETVTVGAIGFLSKPIRAKQLDTAIRVHLAEHPLKKTTLVQKVPKQKKPE